VNGEHDYSGCAFFNSIFVAMIVIIEKIRSVFGTHWFLLPWGFTNLNIAWRHCPDRGGSSTILDFLAEFYELGHATHLKA